MEKLKNIGPKCEPLLEKAGITSHEKLKTLGSEEAFIRIWEANHGKIEINAMFLYALEGAIEKIDCLAVPLKRREELKAFAKELRESL